MEQLKNDVKRPTVAQIEEEIKRRKLANEAVGAVRSAVRIILIFAAVAVLITTLVFPVVRVQHSSMEPTLLDGEILVFSAVSSIKRGDIVAFYYNNMLLVKRVVAIEGDWVDLTPEGLVTINGELINEPYITEHNLGETTIELPIQITANRYFVLGDNRAASIDSRAREIGMVHGDRIIGKAVFRILPLTKMGLPK